MAAGFQQINAAFIEISIDVRRAAVEIAEGFRQMGLERPDRLLPHIGWIGDDDIEPVLFLKYLGKVEFPEKKSRTFAFL